MIEESAANKYHYQGESKPKKKHRFGWLIALIVILLVIAVPIASLYIFVYDGSNPREEVTYDVTTSLKQKAVTALNEEREAKEKIALGFNEEDLRGLFQSVTANVKSQSGYLRGFDAKIDGNQYLFECYLGNLPLSFKSKVTLVTTLKEETESYIFKVDSVKLGKIGLGLDTLTKLGVSFDEKEIEETFSNAGLHVTSNLKEGEIIYLKKDAKKDAVALLASSNIDSLYSSLLNELVEMDLLTISSNGGLSLSMDLAPIHTNNSYLTLSKNLTLSSDLKGYCDDVVSLLNGEGDFQKEAPYDTYLMEYLIKGYNKCNDEEKNYVKGKDFNSLGISAPTLYEGKRYAAEGKDLNALLEEKKGSLLTGGIKISEDELNLIFQNTSLLGTSYLVSAPFDGIYRSSYVSIDNFYSNAIDDALSFVIGINIGGYEVPSVLNFKKVDGTSLLSLKKDRFYLGDKKISETLSKTLFDLLASSLQSESWIDVDSETQTINIGNITSPILGVTMKASLKGKSIQEDGYLLFEEKIGL